MFIFAGLGLKRMLAQSKLDPAIICDFAALTLSPSPVIVGTNVAIAVRLSFTALS